MLKTDNNGKTKSPQVSHSLLQVPSNFPPQQSFLQPPPNEEKKQTPITPTIQSFLGETKVELKPQIKSEIKPVQLPEKQEQKNETPQFLQIPASPLFNSTSEIQKQTPLFTNGDKDQNNVKISEPPKEETKLQTNPIQTNMFTQNNNLLFSGSFLNSKKEEVKPGGLFTNSQKDDNQNQFKPIKDGPSIFQGGATSGLFQITKKEEPQTKKQEEVIKNTDIPQSQNSLFSNLTNPPQQDIKGIQNPQMASNQMNQENKLNFGIFPTSNNNDVKGIGINFAAGNTQNPPTFGLFGGGGVGVGNTNKGIFPMTNIPNTTNPTNTEGTKQDNMPVSSLFQKSIQPNGTVENSQSLFGSTQQNNPQQLFSFKK